MIKNLSFIEKLNTYAVATLIFLMFLYLPSAFFIDFVTLVYMGGWLIILALISMVCQFVAIINTCAENKELLTTNFIIFIPATGLFIYMWQKFAISL